MHAAVCLLRAGQPRSAGDAAKLGQFIGQFSWVTGDPIGVKGLRRRLRVTDKADSRRRVEALPAPTGPAFCRYQQEKLVHSNNFKVGSAGEQSIHVHR